MKIFSFEVQRFANIENEVNNTVVSGTADADSIENDGANVTIFGGAGNDFIENDALNVTINGGLGDDSIFLTVTAVTITLFMQAIAATILSAGSSQMIL